MRNSRSSRQIVRSCDLKRGLSACILMLSLGVSVAVPTAVAAPESHPASSFMKAQNVDWLSSDAASYLSTAGVPVLVPSWVPGPFSGMTPEVSADGGSYSLYWMVGGGAPTFLKISGVAGAGFPGGSKANLNVELTINDSVQGFPAIHDLGIPEGSSAPIYDAEMWIADGTLYTVESLNTGSDSPSIANSLIPLSAPAPTEVPQPTDVPLPTEAPLPTEMPSPTEAANADTPPTPTEIATQPVVETPSVSEPTAVPTEAPFSSAPAATSQVDAEQEAQQAQSVSPTAAPTAVPSGTRKVTTAPTPTPWTPTGNSVVPSDGTAGPPRPVIGGDGTGGVIDTSVPLQP